MKLTSNDGRISVFFDKNNVIKKIMLSGDFKEKPADLTTISGIENLTAIEEGCYVKPKGGFHFTCHYQASELILPDTITDIGEGAFWHNRKFRSIRWSSGSKAVPKRLKQCSN